MTVKNRYSEKCSVTEYSIEIKSDHEMPYSAGMSGTNKKQTNDYRSEAIKELERVKKVIASKGEDIYMWTKSAKKILANTFETFGKSVQKILKERNK